METKKEIRKKIFSLRKAHTDQWVDEKSREITRHMAELPEYKAATKIMAYADYNHEVITRYMMERKCPFLRLLARI